MKLARKKVQHMGTMVRVAGKKCNISVLFLEDFLWYDVM